MRSARCLLLVATVCHACAPRALGPETPPVEVRAASSSVALPATSSSVVPHASPFPGMLRGRLEQTSRLRDQGVAYVQTTRRKLCLELETLADGSVVLRARGAEETVGLFLGGPKAKKTGAAGGPVAGPTPVEDRWTGRWVRDGGDPVLRLETRNGGPSFAHDMRCTRKPEPVSGETLDIVRCEPLSAFVGLPWNDHMPKYVRVPLVMAVHGDVHATISGGDGSPLAITLTPAH